MESEANREQPTAADRASSDSNTPPSLSKSKAIATLQNTIQQLEEIVAQLDNDASIEENTFESSVDTLVTITKELATAIAAPSQNVAVPQSPQQNLPEEVQQESSTAASPVPSTPSVAPEPVTEAPKVTTDLSPKPKKARNNNRLLIGAISALIVIGAGILWWWLPQKPVTLLFKSQSTDTEIISPTEDNDTETEAIETATDIDEREIPPTVENTDSVDTSAADLATDAESESILDIDIPSELSAPAAPKEIELETIEPQIVLTPEQNLIAAIQNRVAEITQDYSEDLIVSVEADFNQNSLSVILSDLWYELSESRQNKLANDILKRSRKLDFQKLAIENTEGTLIARNPVIGNTAIVLQRVQE